MYEIKYNWAVLSRRPHVLSPKLHNEFRRNYVNLCVVLNYRALALIPATRLKNNRTKVLYLTFMYPKSISYPSTGRGNP